MWFLYASLGYLAVLSIFDGISSTADVSKSVKDETGSELVTCPCGFDGYTLDCTGIGIDSVPKGCFELYPASVTVILDKNFISRVEEGDFIPVANSLINLSIQDNPLEFIHRNAFGNLSNLETLYINGSKLEYLQPYLLNDMNELKYISVDGPLRNLPKKLFSQNLRGSITVDFYSKDLIVLPCSLLSDLPNGSSINSQAQYQWAAYEETENCSNVFPLPLLTSYCSLAGKADPIIDCTTITEAMTPASASLTAAETGYVFGSYSSILLFPAQLESLNGEIPPNLDCVPLGIDKIADFQIYYQHTENLVLETYYFDLSNLYQFTSSATKSVTVKADTVVLDQIINPLSFPLNIYARQVVLTAPLYSLVNMNDISPQNNPAFYELRHQIGKMNGVTVEYYSHGFIQVALLQSDACLLPDALDFSNDFENMISPIALELGLYCSNTLVEGDTYQQTKALETIFWIKNITRDEADSEIFAINQLAHQLEAKTRTSQNNDTNLIQINYVPYITLMVYKPMLDALKGNLNLFRSIQMQLQDKLERNANRLFDMTLSFEDRKDDLQFISDQSTRALEEAQNVLGTQIQKLEDLRLQTDGVYNTIFIVNDHFIATHNHLELSYNKLQESIQDELDSMFAKKCGAFFKGCFKLFTGRAGVGDVVEGVNGVSDYKRELEEVKEVLTDSMLKINELMGDVENVIQKLDDITAPPSGQSQNWTAIFPDNAPLLALVRQQTVSKYQWEIVDDNNNILLNDDDIKKLGGSADFQSDSGLMKTDGQDLSSNMISFSKLILDIRDEEENLKIANLAVTQGRDRLEEVDDMLLDTVTNEVNYIEKMVQQNLVIMKLMHSLYQKTRKDMNFIMKVLHEYCQSYFYTFFIECPKELRPSPTDSFDDLLYKINQLEYDSLNSIGTLDPPPQPFSKSFVLSDQSPNCTAGTSECPVTTLQQQGKVKIDLSEWWGTDLLDKDRIRLDKVRFYLRDSGKDFVVLHVTPPAIFNDTYQGQVYSFVGHSSQCLIIYEDYSQTDMASAFYQTDCSTHQNYDQFYSRTTPFGSYVLSVAEDGVNWLVSSIEVLVEGSWIPRVDQEIQTETKVPDI